jgi:hypothetical protein
MQEKIVKKTSHSTLKEEDEHFIFSITIFYALGAERAARRAFVRLALLAL